MGRYRSNFLDWRFWTALAACGLILVLGFQQETLRQRELTQRDARAAATRDIAQLSKQIRKLNTQASESSERIGELLSAVNALSEQVTQLGGDPVVTAPGRNTTTSRGNQPTGSPQSPGTTTTSTTRPGRSTTTTTRPTVPPPTTTTSTTRPCTTIPILNRCLSGDT